MIPREYAFATPADLGGSDNYRWFRRGSGLRPAPDGWGLLLCEDAEGRHWTRATADVAYLRMLVESPQTVLADLDVPAEKFTLERPGWPDEWV